MLDSEPEVVRSPRAAVYFHTTISILKKLGLSEEAHEIGLSSTEFMMHWLETGEVMASDMRDALEPGQEFDHNLHFGQHILAELVMRHLARAAGHRGAVEPHASRRSPRPTARSASRSTPRTARSMFEADWVIGTDGARSTVRKLAGPAVRGLHLARPVRRHQHRVPVPRLRVLQRQHGGRPGQLGGDRAARARAAVAADLRRGCEPRRGDDPRAPARAVRRDPARSRRCPTGSTTSRPTACTSAARRASASAGCCWRATRRMPATRAAGSA